MASDPINTDPDYWLQNNPVLMETLAYHINSLPPSVADNIACIAIEDEATDAAAFATYLEGFVAVG